MFRTNLLHIENAKSRGDRNSNEPLHPGSRQFESSAEDSIVKSTTESRRDSLIASVFTTICIIHRLKIKTWLLYICNDQTCSIFFFLVN